MPETRTKVMLNLANPAAALRWWRLPADGVGLARMEFVVIERRSACTRWRCCRFDELSRRGRAREIDALTTRLRRQAPTIFVDRLARGLSRIAAAHYPKPVIVRMSDFKTNEYAGLLGGAAASSRRRRTR